jgi:hypothetical protein
LVTATAQAVADGAIPRTIGIAVDAIVDRARRWRLITATAHAIAHGA